MPMPKESTRGVSHAATLARTPQPVMYSKSATAGLALRALSGAR